MLDKVHAALAQRDLLPSEHLVEGTFSQAVRRCSLRRCRYIGLDKTHLQNVLIATAFNALRATEWLAGHRPALTRQGAFARLQSILG
jgi:transposase